MVLPAVRRSFGRQDAKQLVALLGRGDQDLLEGAETRLDELGIDALLDDPRVRTAILTEVDVAVRPEVVFYVLVRQALLESSIDNVVVSDYVSTLLLAFGKGSRAYRPSDDDSKSYAYLVDLVGDLRGADSRQAFLLRTHLGNYALWMTGMFPDYIEARTTRRGGPSVRYYEDLGRMSFREAAESGEAEALGISRILTDVAQRFAGVRGALNRISDRVLHSSGANPVNRLLREVSLGFSPSR